MGQKLTVVQSGFELLFDQIRKSPTLPTDIETASTVNYTNFMNNIAKLNKICANYMDEDGNYVMFAIKEKSDLTFLWKATVQIACIILNSKTKKIEYHRLLTLREFIVFSKKISYECSDKGTIGISGSSQKTPQSIAASLIKGEGNDSDDSNLDECIICMENKADVIQSCSHAFCMPCIEQWKEKDSSCPVCRELLPRIDDTWVLTEKPSDKDVENEILRSLMRFAKPE